MRLRQDQDAFVAYITYHQNVGMTLPSYDEAVSARQQGEPPTFDEAVADSDDRQPVDATSTPVATDSEVVAVGKC